MLALAKVREAQRLLAEGRLSQRKIARLVGISRTTVGAIASGKRPDYEERLRARAEACEPLGPIERCPTCGGMVHAPCRLCRVRKLKDLERQQVRLLRRRAREQALRRLLIAVERANRQRDAEQEKNPVLEKTVSDTDRSDSACPPAVT